MILFSKPILDTGILANVRYTIESAKMDLESSLLYCIYPRISDLLGYADRSGSYVGFISFLARRQIQTFISHSVYCTYEPERVQTIRTNIRPEVEMANADLCPIHIGCKVVYIPNEGLFIRTECGQKAYDLYVT